MSLHRAPRPSTGLLSDLDVMHYGGIAVIAIPLAMPLWLATRMRNAIEKHT